MSQPSQSARVEPGPIIQGDWGSFEEGRTLDASVLQLSDIQDITLLPSEHGSFSTGGRVSTSKGDFHIKVFSPTAFHSFESMLMMREDEAEMLIALDGADGHTPRLWMTGVFIDIEGNRYPALIMDRVRGISLYRAMRVGIISGDINSKPDGIQTTRLSLMIARGIQSCTKRGITHRDLWPANIILQTGKDGVESATFIDFGNSTESLRSTVTAISSDMRLARQNYGAPEVFGIDARQRLKRNAASVDVWSLGALIYYIRTGCEPMGVDPVSGRIVDPADINNMTEHKLKYLAEIKGECLDLAEKLSEQGQTLGPLDRNLAWLVARCTESRPMARPAIEDIIDELEYMLDASSRGIDNSTPCIATPLMSATQVKDPGTPPKTPRKTAKKAAKKTKRAPIPRKRIGIIAASLVLVLAIAGMGIGIIANDRNIERATVRGVQSEYAYTAAPIEPEIYVASPLGFALVGDEDYTVEYQNNKQAGTATIVVRGTGNHYGETSSTFTIQPQSIEGGELELTKKKFTYTGKPIKPAVTVRIAGAKLAEGTDYSVSYSNNKKPGKATVIVKGKGNYTGSLKASFTIEEKKKEEPAQTSQPAYSYEPSYSSSSDSESSASSSTKTGESAETDIDLSDL